VGLKVVVVGTGLFIVNVNPDEVPPPGVGLNTVTVVVPAVAIFAAGTTAVKLVAETYVVVKLDAPHLTTDCELKLVPVTVNVNCAPPAAAVLGLNVVAVGAGLFIVNVNPDDVPPPGVGLNTVTAGVPAVAIFAAGTTAVKEVADT
jgi:hypothetical protein